MSSQPNQSLIDGLACLQYLASSRKPVGCREMARDLNINHMRSNRLLKTLADIGLAQQDKKKKYFIGPGIHALTAQAIFGSSILKQALPLIKAIPCKGITVALGVLWRGNVTYLFHGKVGEGLDQGIGRIGLIPYYRSTIGMLLLSYEEDEVIKELHKNTESGITEKSLMADINKIRKNNYCIKTHDGSEDIGLAYPIGLPPRIGIAFAGIPGNEDIKVYQSELKNISDKIIL